MRTATPWLGLGSAVAACALAGLLLGGYFAALGLCPLDRAAGAVEPSTLTLRPLLPQAYPTRFGVQLPQVQRGETPSPTPSGSPSATPVTGTSTITPTPGPVDPFERIIVDPGSIYYEIGGVQYRPTPAPTSLAGPTGCGAGFACLVDGDLSTVWVPTSNADLTGWLYVPLGGPNYASDVDSLSRVTIWPQVAQPPATPAAVAPFRYEVWVQANDAQPVHLCTLQGWTPLAAMTCVPEQPVAHAAWVIIGILPPVDWHSRLAEIQIDMARRPPAPRTPTPSTPTGSATPTVTRTGTPPTATATGTPTPGALDTLEPIVGNATTMYYRAGGTDYGRTPMLTATGTPAQCTGNDLYCLADGQVSTAWTPPNDALAAVWVYLPLDGPNYWSQMDSLVRVDIVPRYPVGSPTPTPGSGYSPFRYEVWAQVDGQSPVKLCSLQGETELALLSCAPASAVARASWVMVGFMPPVDGRSAIAEVRAYKVRTPATPTGTATSTRTPTRTLTPTRTATDTLTPTPEPTTTQTPTAVVMDRVPYVPPLPSGATSHQSGYAPEQIADGVTQADTGWFPEAGSQSTQYVRASLDNHGYYSSAVDSVAAIELYPAVHSHAAPTSTPSGTPPSTLTYDLFAIQAVPGATGTPTPLLICRLSVPLASADTKVACPLATPISHVSQVVVGIPPRSDTGVVDGTVGVAELVVYKVRQPVAGSAARQADGGRRTDSRPAQAGAGSPDVAGLVLVADVGAWPRPHVTGALIRGALSVGAHPLLVMGD